MKIDTFTKSIFMTCKNILHLFFFLFLTLFFKGNAQEKKDSTISIQMKLQQPPYLQKGDTVAILAPAGVLENKEDVIAKARALLESWSLKVVLGNNLFNKENHFAGTDKERLDDFQKALDNPNIKAIWAARGGYGSVRILDRLNFTTFKKHPKWIVGYSDITALHSHIHNLGVETIHGMMAVDLQEEKEITSTISTLKKALFGERLTYTLASSKYNRKGVSEGILTGGNLTLLMTMLGSKSAISTSGKILFIEEIGEYKYHIDRMLQSLKRAGYFKNCKGIIVGNMSKIKKNTTAWGASIEELILNVVAEFNFPVLFNFSAGHELNNLSLIMGRKVKIDVKEQKAKVFFE